jgi:hypothetical protein
MSIIKRFLISAAALILFSIPSLASSFTSSIASTTASYASKDLMLFKNETLTWTLTGTATGTVSIQRSENRVSWRNVGSAVSGTGVVSTGGTILNTGDEAFYRMLVTTITAGTFVCGMADVNDFVMGVKNHKGVDVVKVYDESVTMAGTSASSFGGSLTVASSLSVGGDYNTTASANEVYGVAATVGLSTAITSGNSQGRIRYVYLKGTQPAVEGSLLVSTTPASTNNGVTVAVSNLGADVTSWLGICAVAASTGSVVAMYDDGFVLALATGAITAGATLVNATNAGGRGYLKADTTPTTGADVGVALSARTTTAGGLIRIKLR